MELDPLLPALRPQGWRQQKQSAPPYPRLWPPTGVHYGSDEERRNAGHFPGGDTLRPQVWKKKMGWGKRGHSSYSRRMQRLNGALTVPEGETEAPKVGMCLR